MLCVCVGSCLLFFFSSSLLPLSILLMVGHQKKKKESYAGWRKRKWIGCGRGSEFAKNARREATIAYGSREFQWIGQSQLSVFAGFSKCSERHGVHVVFKKAKNPQAHCFFFALSTERPFPPPRGSCLCVPGFKKKSFIRWGDLSRPVCKGERRVKTWQENLFFG